MNTLDTNVLVRYLVGDIPEQAEAARELIEELTQDAPGFICREVVLEVAWCWSEPIALRESRLQMP